jgi:hypothetical protein
VIDLDFRDFGTQIAVDKTPGKFYIIAGDEYGIKYRYLRMIADIYGNKPIECDSVDYALSLMQRQHLIPLEPTLYIIRYDDAFIKSIKNYSADDIRSIDIIGTIAVVYGSDADSDKCEKYLPEYTVRFNPVSIDYVKKYLMQDFEKMTLGKSEIAVSVCKEYYGARMAAFSLTNLDDSVSAQFDAVAIKDSISADTPCNITRFKTGIAARDFNYCVRQISRMDDLSSVLYAILSTMLDIEKAIELPKSKSWCAKYVKNWNKYDVVIMFNNAYNVLLESRNTISFDMENALIMILCSMRFSPVIQMR